jgi:hypothetical protein
LTYFLITRQGKYFVVFGTEIIALKRANHQQGNVESVSGNKIIHATVLSDLQSLPFYATNFIVTLQN